MLRGGPRSYQLHYNDIQSVYPGRGISDAVVDFFVRCV